MKPIVCYDVETTGLSPKEDYIIQLSCIKFDRETFDVLGELDYYIKPIHKYTISPEATDVHGLTKEFIEENGINLKDIAEEFINFIDGCDILTYNGNNFDIQFLYKDFELCGYDLKLEGRMFYDAYSIECTKHPRTLSTIYTKYTGKELDGAHNSLNDVKATIDIFKGQMSEMTFEEADEMPGNQLISPDGSIRRPNNDKNIIVMARGKYKDVDFMDVYKKDPSYIEWFFKNVASSYTKNVL
ncbi:MAG: 3'-5' exonuclease, partial [Parabacteroides sp.]|nr:3'-5' exonuclease [Parabacteroides sp.]